MINNSRFLDSDLDWNEYGFIGSVRYGTTVLFPQAIAIGNTAGTLVLETDTD